MKIEATDYALYKDGIIVGYDVHVDEQVYDNCAVYYALHNNSYYKLDSCLDQYHYLFKKKITLQEYTMFLLTLNLGVMLKDSSILVQKQPMKDYTQ